MQCPHCGSTARHAVKETRSRDGLIARRRRCESCGRDFQTSERVSALGLRVRKADGSLVPFDEDSIRRSVRRASVQPHRLERLAGLTDAVVSAARARANGGVIDSLEIGAAVLRNLKRLDRASHVRFALVHLGRLDRAGHQGWGTIGDVRGWLLDEYPDLQHYRAPVHLSEVVKRNGQREPFDRKKLERSIGRAAKGRGHDAADVYKLAEDIAGDVLDDLGEQPLVTSGQIAAEILRSLRRRDHIAFLRYASTAKGYHGPEDYEAEAVALRRHE